MPFCFLFKQRLFAFTLNFLNIFFPYPSICDPCYVLACSIICANLESRELTSFLALLLTSYIVEGQSLYISARLSHLWNEGVSPDALKPFQL